MVENSKMYILVKESLPLGFAMVSLAHSSLACFLKFKDNENMQDWLKNSFRKVVCAVSDEEFELAKSTPDHVLLTESNLDGMEVALAFCPRDEWPESFRKFKLWPSKI